MKAGIAAMIGKLALPLLVAGCASIPPASNGLASRSLGTHRAAAFSPPRDYASACAPCHDRGGYGVRVMADRLGARQSLLHGGTRMPPEAIHVVVRRGLGAMPAISRAEVSDSELQAIVAYLSSVGRSGSSR